MMHPNHMHEPTKLAPFDIEEQRLNSEPLPTVLLFIFYSCTVCVTTHNFTVNNGN